MAAATPTIRRVLAVLLPSTLAIAISSRPVRAAVNQTMATESAVLSDGAEVAFFPPVTGG